MNGGGGGGGERRTREENRGSELVKKGDKKKSARLTIHDLTLIPSAKAPTDPRRASRDKALENRMSCN